ncbi:hypothetical protein [Streptosporangium sp. NPDC002721]|uniref:hypothetical protein n=1 Tax=Streptosporangium sp. NPDC002721 TaxID=3366188 RepID=UPI003697AB6A
MRGSTKTILLAAALSIGGIVVNPAPAVASVAGPAHTVAPAVSPERVCGPGFARVARSKQAVRTPSGDVLGHVYLLYDRRTGYNCVTTIKTSNVGVATFASATVTTQRMGASSSGPGRNEGRQVKSHIGPLKVYGKGRCVRYSGTIWDDGRGAAVAKARWKSWGRCG